ncbi:hypothetical protein M8R20_26355 [Pseudomonas sp. R2.Fl]|nr:hypothetical protein [Pseudomonas sp. R2.Fl]MCL6710466.1 hypothetical protein [Pseudomonas sp. R2.Fl]MCL6710526.1 hypothetical protein [Pseudomonas sp. R2.Fl]
MSGLVGHRGLLLGGGPTGSWTTTDTQTLTNNSTGWANNTLRVVIPTSKLAAGSQIRFRLTAGTQGFNIVNAYCQTRAASGDPYDFATTPNAVLFSGSTGVMVGASASIVTDPVVMPVTTSSPIVLAVAFPTTPASSVMAGAGTGWPSSTYFKTGNDASTVNATGYSAASFALYMLTQIEVFQP